MFSLLFDYDAGDKAVSQLAMPPSNCLGLRLS